MKKEHETILNEFGKALMEGTRDEAVLDVEMILSGKTSHPVRRKVYESTLSFTEEQKKILRKFILDSIDNALFHFFRLLDEHEELDLIKYQDEEKKNYLSLKNISDGLGGDLVGEDGWIEKYSKYPPSVK